MTRRQTAGPNSIPRVPGPPLLGKFVAQFTHLMALLLWVGAGLAAVAIVAVNVLNGVFSFWQEFRAQKATEALQKLLPRWARVIRGGQETRIPAEEVVPGDILVLAEGEHICADARLIWDVDFRADQSILTGESRAVSRTADPGSDPKLPWIQQPNLVFAVATVSSGSARAVAFATGGSTEFGRIAHLTQSLPETPSPLQLEMARERNSTLPYFRFPSKRGVNWRGPSRARDSSHPSVSSNIRRTRRRTTLPAAWIARSATWR